MSLNVCVFMNDILCKDKDNNYMVLFENLNEENIVKKKVCGNINAKTPQAYLPVVFSVEEIPFLIEKTAGILYLKSHSIKDIIQLARGNIDNRTNVLYNVTIATLERVNGRCAYGRNEH